MPSRRDVLRGAGGLAALGAIAVSLDRGVVRTKLGSAGTQRIDLDEPDEEAFVRPENFETYREDLRGQYGPAVIPWDDPATLDGDFLGSFRLQVPIVSSNRYAVQSAALLVHDLGAGRYRLRLWSAGRLFDRRYPVDPWGVYTEEPAFTWLEQGIEGDSDATVSTGSVRTTAGGATTVGGGTVSVPDGTFLTRSDTAYRSRWEGFYAGVVPIIGACRVTFGDGADRRLRWRFSNGVGVRTPV